MLRVRCQTQKLLYMANMLDNARLQGVLQRMHLLKSKKTRPMILDDISGIIPAGRMTGLLGPPGSGKSSLLQALAGKLQKTDLEVWTVIWTGFTSMSLAATRNSLFQMLREMMWPCYIGHMCGPNLCVEDAVLQQSNHALAFSVLVDPPFYLVTYATHFPASR